MGTFRPTTLPRAWLACALALIGLVAFGGVAPDACAGDPELAKFLLKGGKEDLAKKQYDAALTKFERAEREDPTLLEAIFQHAVALEKRDDTKGAVQTYRRFIAGIEAKQKSGTPTKEELSLAKTAQGRVDVLAAGGAERRKLDDAFVEALMAFARANFVKDPTIAAEALQILLGVRPDHAEAKKLLAQVQPAVAAPPPSNAPAGPTDKPAADAERADGFKAVKAWKDLFETKYFGHNDGWTYETDRLVIDRRGAASIVRPPGATPTGPRYAMEAECRLVDVHGERPLIGIVFSYSDGNMFSLFLTEKEVVLHRDESGEPADVARVDVVPPGTGGWHRIGVVVRVNTIEVWLDGKKRSDYTASQRLNLSGEIGVFHQNCKAEIRVLRAGEIAP